VTPVLSDLRIEYEYVDSTQWAQSPFVSFLCRSACALRKLDLTDIPITDVQLIECLRMLPSLVELIIDYEGPRFNAPFPVTDMLLQQLIYQPPELRSLPLLSPRLQAITFEGHFMVDGRIFVRYGCFEMEDTWGYGRRCQTPTQPSIGNEKNAMCYTST
jgi:hypothetical protein